jgi:hypothetical protein
MPKEARQLIKKLESSIDELQSKLEVISKMTKPQKDKRMKNKLVCTHDLEEMSRVPLSKKKFRKSIQEFFLNNSNLEEDESFYIIKAFIDDNNELQTYGAYYGVEMSPFTFLINSDEESEEVFLAEVTKKETMADFIEGKRKRDVNMFAFKIQSKDFKLSKIESLYGGPYELDLYIFNYQEEESGSYGEVLKRL